MTVWILTKGGYFKGAFETADLAKDSRPGLCWVLYGGHQWVADFKGAGPGEAMAIEEHEVKYELS